MGQGTRRQRVANTMRDVLNELIAREVKDPRVHAAGLVSVSQVELNRDLSVAWVYVSFLGGPGGDDVDQAAVERALAGLKAAAGFLRGPIGRRMRLQRTPELRFARDIRAAFGQRMGEILHDDAHRGGEAGEAAPDAPGSAVASGTAGESAPEHGAEPAGAATDPSREEHGS